MKTLFFSLLMMSFLSVNAQSDEPINIRKGKTIVETGYSLYAGIIGNGISGGTFLINDGDTQLSLAFDGGYFISEDFALKGKVSFITSDGNTLTFLGVGPKYYLGGVAPFELNVGKVFGDDFFSDDFIGFASLGYAITLADNIYLEPAIGYSFPFESLGDGFTVVDLSFCLLF